MARTITCFSAGNYTLLFTCKFCEKKLYGIALSFCTENPIDPVVNETEWTFPPKMFREKRYSSFLGFPGMIGKSCSICFFPLVPCSLKKEKNMANPTGLGAFAAQMNRAGFNRFTRMLL